MPRLDPDRKAALLALRAEMERLIAAGTWSEQHWRRLAHQARAIAPTQPDLFSFLVWHADPAWRRPTRVEPPAAGEADVPTRG